jgi:hypothetical protein
MYVLLPDCFRGGGCGSSLLFLCVLLSSPGLYNSTVCVGQFQKRINKGRNLFCCVTRVQLGGGGGDNRMVSLILVLKNWVS